MQSPTYTENGVQYDVTGLLSTTLGMAEKDMIKRVLLHNIDNQIMQYHENQQYIVDYLDYQATDEVKWVVEHMMRLVSMATRDEKKVIYNTVSETL